MKRWDLVRKYKDWRGRYKITTKTFETEKALRKEIAKITAYLSKEQRPEDIEYTIRVWELIEDFSMDSYITEQKRANQIDAVFGDVDPSLSELTIKMESLFSKDYQSLIEEWGMVNKSSKKEMSAFFATHRLALQLYPTSLEGEDYVAWWELLLRNANYVKLTGEVLYVGYRNRVKATPEMVEQFNEILKRKRKKK
jgi:hypothetical protein